MTTLELALDRFRRDFGAPARPEDYPTVWHEYLDEAEEDLRAREEGGEG